MIIKNKSAELTVKVFTYLDRPSSPFLRTWINYYTKNVEADLCILHRNAHLGNIDITENDNIEVICVDNLIDSSFHNEWIIPSTIFDIYQKQFLKTHDVVIFCDVDEFIVHDDLDNLIRGNYINCLVTTGIEIVENYPTDLKFDVTQNINNQREYMVRSEWYDKPIILNSPFKWNAGKHNHGMSKNYVDGLYLIHLGRVCLDTYVKLHSDTRKLYSSSNYIETFNQEWYIKHFNDPTHPEQPMIKIPHNIKKLIDKII